MKASRPLTRLELALLGLVHTEPRSGYDLCKVFETTAMGHYSSSPGAIYPAIKRLEKRGLVEGTTDSPGSLRPRRLYALSPQGLEVLRDWVSRPVTADDVAWRLDELLLRFSFMDGLADPATLCRFLDLLETGTAKVVAELERQRRELFEDATGAPSTGRLALEHGIETYRGTLRWAQRARTDLACTPQSAGTRGPSTRQSSVSPRHQPR